MSFFDPLKRRRSHQDAGRPPAAEDSPKSTILKTIPVCAVPGFVCYVDLLGFSSFTLRSTLQDSIDDFAVVRSILLQSAVLISQDNGYLQDKESMAKYALNPFDTAVEMPFRYIMASDSIFYWGMDTVRKLIITMKSVAFSLYMMALRQSRFARGSVARGRPMINPLAGIYFGKPIVEAVTLEREMAAPGVVIPLQCLTDDERLEVIDHLPYFVPTNYRLKNGKTMPCLYVNWVYDYVRRKEIRGLDELARQFATDRFFPEKSGQLIEFLRDNLDTFPFPVLGKGSGA